MLFTVVQITPVCFQNEPKMTANVCNPVNKPGNFIIWKVTYHICSKTRRQCSTRVKYSTGFYLHNQKTDLNSVNQCEPGLSIVSTWIDANHAKPVTVSRLLDYRTRVLIGAKPTRIAKLRPPAYCVMPSRAFEAAGFEQDLPRYEIKGR